LAVHVTSVAPKAADQAVQQKLMPVSVALDANGQATPALAQEALGPGPGRRGGAAAQARPDGKAEALFLDSIKPGMPRWPRACKRRWKRALAKLPIPKVMTYQLEQGEGADFQPGWTSVKFVRPATWSGCAAWRTGGALVRAGPEVGARDAGPPF
jgi:glycyl-tRNA synthetase beta chain